MQNYTMKRRRMEWREKSGSAGDQVKEHEELGKLRSQERVAEVSCWLLWPERKNRVGGREMDAGKGQKMLNILSLGKPVRAVEIILVQEKKT